MKACLSPPQHAGVSLCHVVPQHFYRSYLRVCGLWSPRAAPPLPLFIPFHEKLACTGSAGACVAGLLPSHGVERHHRQPLPQSTSQRARRRARRGLLGAATSPSGRVGAVVDESTSSPNMVQVQDSGDLSREFLGSHIIPKVFISQCGLRKVTTLQP